MRQAIFAKYHKGLSISEAYRCIEHLYTEGATPFEYNVLYHHYCTNEELSRLLQVGSIIIFPQISHCGMFSMPDEGGIWRCIMLSTMAINVLVYTAGSADILYYSVT